MNRVQIAIATIDSTCADLRKASECLESGELLNATVYVKCAGQKLMSVMLDIVIAQVNPL